MSVARSRLLLPSSLLLAVIFILSPVSLTEANAQESSCDKLDYCDFYWSEWSSCSATCTGVKRRNATVCCPPTSGTLQLCSERCFETFQLINRLPDSAPCRCVNRGRRSSSGACDCPPGYFGNCCQEKITNPEAYKDNDKEDEEGVPDQPEDDSAKHGCEHDSQDNDQHHDDEENNSSCEDDDTDDSSLSAGAVTAIVLVSVGSFVGACVNIAVLCHRKRVAVGAGGGATTGVVVVKPPKPTASVYTIDVKQKNKMADDVTASPPPAYWEAVEASAPPSYQSYLALNEVGLDGQATSAKH